MTNLDSIFKSRDITLPTKARLIKAMVFPVVMYGCESWTVKKAECQRTDAFELWCWRRLLRVPWTARRSNQSILKEISPGCSLEGMILKLKLQYFGHLMWRADSLEKTLMLGGIGAGGEGDDRGWDGWMASLTWWTWVCGRNFDSFYKTNHTLIIQSSKCTPWYSPKEVENLYPQKNVHTDVTVALLIIPKFGNNKDVLQ